MEFLHELLLEPPADTQVLLTGNPVIEYERRGGSCGSCGSRGAEAVHRDPRSSHIAAAFKEETDVEK